MPNPNQDRNPVANPENRNPLLRTVTKKSSSPSPKNGDTTEANRFSADSPDDNEFEDKLANEGEPTDSGKPIP